MEEFIYKYGYWTVFLGSCIEGESILLTAGFLAAKGYLSLEKIIIVSFIGTLLADQGLYFFGRYYGGRFLRRFPKLQPKADQVFALLQKYGNAYIMIFRFIYGIRIISPVIIGASGISVRRFAILNLIAAAVWSVIICYVGYGFGEILRPILDNIEEYQRYIVAGVVGIVLIVVGIIHWWRQR